MTTPGKSRQSGIPGPGRISSIPTPGRSRSSSSAYQNTAPSADSYDISRAFADAIKANDPAQHRIGPPAHAASTSSLSPQFASQTTQSGRRSVVGRPHSAASTSSAVGTSTRTAERAKTPTSARPPSRPPSRHSEAFGRSISRSFEIGDNVRIESLGFEGLLKYLGEIEGKPGLWAGVELSGGFTGKGKNNGTVNGKKYFSCPQNCGVFVATTKLSPPTVGPGTIPRPSSVASSRGRVTPALSGRVTPSFPSAMRTPSTTYANGRVTPSASERLTPSSTNGRGTPATTPAANVRTRNVIKPTTSKGTDISLTDKITAGSRASKYMSMTAQQLSSRDSQNLESPTRRNGESPSPAFPSSSFSSSSSPSRGSRMLSSPTRSSGSPFSTPKPTLGGKMSTAGNTGLPSLPSRNRPSVSTPRARVPSAVAMPPPASPISASSYSDHAHYPDSEPSSATCLDGFKAHGQALQDNTPLLTSKNTSLSSSSRPESSASIRSTTMDEQSLVEQLQSRLDALEYENERLRSASGSGDEFTSVVPAHLESLERERDEAMARISYLEEKQAESKSNTEVHAHRICSLEQDLKRITSETDAQRLESQSCVANLQRKAEEDALVIQELQESLNARSNLIHQQNEDLGTKQGEIALLNLKLESTFKELEEEKKELGAQIDELRIAGQETIALYEERLSAADAQRYELELRITSLEAGILSAGQGPSPQGASHSPSSATQIDNETLRDQVHHLQRKISTMEDVIEDARAASEKEEAAFRERMRRLKEKEEGMKKELSEGRKEVERMTTSELNARSRVEEIEEALRESTVALENARAEVEALRAEIANVDSLVGDISEGDLSSRVAELTHRASVDRARSEQEILRLTDMLQEFRPNVNQKDVSLESQILTLQQQNATLEAKVLDMTRALDDSTNELESTRKKLNRDVFIANDVHDGFKPLSSSPSKSEPAVAKEEVTGLKHIVQELQKESIAAAQRIKFLESENQLFSCEAEQLRQELHLLEDSLRDSLSREDRELVQSTTSPNLHDVDSLQQRLKEQSVRYDAEMEQVKKRLSESEMKHARMVYDLNKEISELEALVEAKIYREDELEQEVERLKDKVARAKKSSKSSTETSGTRHRLSSTSSSTMSSGGTGQDICEICERPGHDIFNCGLLKEDGVSGETIPVSTWQPRTVVDVFCEDCESHGHVAADCPHSLDVF